MPRREVLATSGRSSAELRNSKRVMAELKLLKANGDGPRRTEVSRAFGRVAMVDDCGRPHLRDVLLID